MAIPHISLYSLSQNSKFFTPQDQKWVYYHNAHGSVKREGQKAEEENKSPERYDSFFCHKSL